MELIARRPAIEQDGYLDIIQASYYDGSSYSTNSFVYWGRSGHAEADRVSLPTHGAHSICVADLDGNGWQDIVIANNNDGDNAEAIMARNGSRAAG